MITNDYIQGLLAGLKMVAENVQHRVDSVDTISPTDDDYESGFTSGRVNELEAVAQHLNQIRESYKQLIKEHNDAIKNQKART